MGRTKKTSNEGSADLESFFDLYVTGFLNDKHILKRLKN